MERNSTGQYNKRQATHLKIGPNTRIEIHKRENPNDNKYMKKESVSLMIRGVQIKITMRFHHTQSWNDGNGIHSLRYSQG